MCIIMYSNVYYYVIITASLVIKVWIQAVTKATIWFQAELTQIKLKLLQQQKCRILDEREK